MKTELVLSFLVCCPCIFVKSDPVVNTELGPIQGITIKTPSGKYVDAYLAIPYAKPPIGPDRFLPPMRIEEPWQDTLVAKDFPNSCIQGMGNFPDERMNWFIADSEESEDCLYLSIWVPNPKPEKLAVLVWIYGGGFNAGSTNIKKYNGAILASEENVIVISINYRLGMFGFLHLPDTEVTGNMGLFDQVEALKWVQENIVYFGGDRKKVTIFGESAGGMAVAMHLVSSESQNLFHSAIIQSTSLTPGKTSNKDLRSNVSAQIMKNLNCSDESNNQAILDCLRKVKAEAIREETLNNRYFLYLPKIDGKFLTSDFQISMLKKEFHKVNVMLGATSEDGSIFPAMILDNDAYSFREDYYPSRSDFQKVVRKIMPSGDDAIHKALDSIYTDWRQDPNDPLMIRQKIIKMTSDYMFICGTNTLAKHLTEAGRSAFLYQFSQIPSVSQFPKWMGSGHGDEIEFIFGLPLNPKNGYSKKEVQLSKKMMRYWANFAKYSNPNGKETSRSKSDSFQWPQHTAYGKEYINLSTNISTGNGIHLRECAFWDDVIPELLRRTPKEL